MEVPVISAVILIIFSALVRTEEKCGDKKIDMSSAIFSRDFSESDEEGSKEKNCLALTEALHCLREAEAECNAKGETNTKIEEGKAFLSLMGAANCETGENPKIKECVKELEPELRKCDKHGEAEHLKEKEPDEEEEDIKCRIYMSTAECILAIVDDKCGEEAVLSELAKMLDKDEMKKCESNRGSFLLGLKRRK